MLDARVDLVLRAPAARGGLIAARLWYQRIPGLFVFGGSAECFQYTGKKAQVFDRRANSVRRLAQRMLSACRLPFRVVSGVKELLPLRDHVVDGIGHYEGSLDAYDKFTRALAEFCMLVPDPLPRSRLYVWVWPVPHGRMR